MRFKVLSPLTALQNRLQNYFTPGWIIILHWSQDQHQVCGNTGQTEGTWYKKHHIVFNHVEKIMMLSITQGHDAAAHFGKSRLEGGVKYKPSSL